MTSNASAQARFAEGQEARLALIVSERLATVAGMFTTNQVCAAPEGFVERVKQGRRRLSYGELRQRQRLHGQARYEGRA